MADYIFVLGTLGSRAVKHPAVRYVSYDMPPLFNSRGKALMDAKVFLDFMRQRNVAARDPLGNLKAIDQSRKLKRLDGRRRQLWKDYTNATTSNRVGG